MHSIVDTNVIVDLFDPQSRFANWSERQIISARREGSIVLNPIIYAELAAGFSSERVLDNALMHFLREDLPWDAAFFAGKAFFAYRRSGGSRRSPLPDFYIGAHAMVRNYRLVTRDVARYRTYFPSLDIIAPDTHP